MNRHQKPKNRVKIDKKTELVKLSPPDSQYITIFHYVQNHLHPARYHLGFRQAPTQLVRVWQ